MLFDPQKVKKQSINFQEINKILEKAYKNILEAEKGSDPDSKFSLAYESMLKTALALLRSYGYRPRSGAGHHAVLVQLSKKILGPKFDNLTSTYNQMRKKRNKILYDINSATKLEAGSSVHIARRFFQAVEQKISKDNPQQKFWKPWFYENFIRKKYESRFNFYHKRKKSKIIR